jgi:hypothetical protein
MKTPAWSCLSRSLSAGSLLLAVAHAAPAVPAVPAAPPAAPDATAKPYVLFMRTDVAVEQNKKLYPVKDVSGRDFIVSVDGQKVTVPMAGGSRRLEFQHALTLARTSASLSGLESERAYTPGRDPRMQRQRDAVLAEAVIGDNASLAEGKFIAGLNKGYVAVNADARAPDGTPLQGAAATAAAIDANGAAAAASAFQALGQAETLHESNITSGGFARLAAENDLAQEQYDAVSVRFEVSSPVYLEKPYVVVITRFHARDDKPGVARNAVYAKALEAIGAKPTKIELLHGGFPLGFEIENLQVHLYNEGHEIPTDVAQKRVPLTRDEAFEYLKIEYVSGHKGETVPATPALGRPDKEERLKLSPNQWKADYYAKVSKDGLPLGTYLDEACRQPVDDLVAALAQNVRYYPAMEKGKPVEGIARLSWRYLAL